MILIPSFFFRRGSARRDPARRDPARRDPARRDPARRDPARRDPARRVAVLAVFALSSVAVAQSPARLLAIDLVKEAATDFARGNMLLVMKNCHQAIHLDPTYPRAYTWLGFAHQKRGERPDACRAFANVVRLAPDSPDAVRAGRGLLELDCAHLNRPSIPLSVSPRAEPFSKVRPHLGTPPKLVPATFSNDLARLTAHWTATSGVAALAFSSDGQFLSGGGTDGSWRLWRLPDGRLERLETGARYEMSAVAAAPSAFIAGSGDGKIRFFGASSRDEGAPIAARSGAVNGLALSADGHLLAASGPDGAIKMFEARTHQLLWQVAAGGFSLSGAAWSPDNRFVAVGVGNLVRVFEAQNGHSIRTLTGDAFPLSAVAWSRDGQQIAGASGTKIRLWKASGALQRVLSGHDLSIVTLAFGAGSTLASSGYDGQIRVWNALTGALRGVAKPGSSLIRSVVFDGSGQNMAAADQSGRISVWRVAN